MSSGPRPSRAASADYRAAIAQWRLDLRTEVKRCSSLPSSMFDACDPTLETHLAATAESVLMTLLGGNQDPFPSPGGDAAEQRREQVSPEELRRLPRLVADGEPMLPVAFDTDLQPEYLAILGDLCCTADGAPLAHARELVARDFGPEHLSDLETLRAGREGKGDRA